MESKANERISNHAPYCGGLDFTTDLHTSENGNFHLSA